MVSVKPEAGSPHSPARDSPPTTGPGSPLRMASPRLVDRPEYEPLDRQVTLPLTDPAGFVAGLPQLEPRISRSSRVSGRSGQNDYKDRDLISGVRRGSDIPEAERSDYGEYDGEKGREDGPAPAVGAVGADVPPDGGFKAWLVVFGAFWTVFVGFGIISGVGAFQTYYRTELLEGYSESEISWIVSTQTFLTFGLSCFTGALFDKYGHRPLIATGTFCLVLGFCMLSLCSQYYQLMLVHASFLPVGCNLMFICPVAVVGQWFSRRRGLAFGIMSSGSSIGSVVWPILLANLPQRIGFGWTLRLIALMCGILGVISFFLLKTRLPPKPAGAFFYLEAFKSPQYTLIVANFVFLGYGFFAYLTFIGTYGQLAGLGTLAPYLLVIQNASSVIGRLGSGILADRIGTYNANILGNVLFVIMYFAWLGCEDTGSCIALVVVMGIAGGSFVTLQPPLAVMTAKDMRYGGTMVGQALFVMSLAQLASGPSFGALIGTGTTADRFSSFPRAIGLSAALSCIGATCCIVARLYRERKFWARA